MRYASLAKLVVLSILAPVAMFGQTLTITNYQLVSQQATSSTATNYTNYTYTAQLNNIGVALGSVTATASSANPFSVRIVPSAAVLNFGPIPANGTAASLNNFTIVVNTTEPFSWSNIQWTFQTTPAGPIANAGP